MILIDVESEIKSLEALFVCIHRVHCACTLKAWIPVIESVAHSASSFLTSLLGHGESTDSLPAEITPNSNTHGRDNQLASCKQHLFPAF